MRFTCVLLAAAAVLLGACSEKRNKTAPPKPDPGPGLVRVHGCEGVVAAIRREAIASLNRSIETWLADYPKKAEHHCAHPKGGGSVLYGSFATGLSYSQPNVQVPGVDEPDTVQNDDRYIHVLTSGQWHIIDALPVETARVVARVPIEGRPQKMLVNGKFAVVFSTVPSPHKRNPSLACATRDCRNVAMQDGTLVSIFELASRYSPRLMRTMRLSGKYVTARRVGDAVHLVVSDPAPYLPELKRIEDALPCPPPPLEQAKAALESFRKENTRIINTSHPEDWPVITESVVDYGVVAPATASLRSARRPESGIAEASRMSILSRPCTTDLPSAGPWS